MTEATTSDQVVDSSAVENLVQVLVKGLRAIQLYLPNNPIYQKAVDNVRAAFAPVWDEMPELYIRVTESELLWEDIPVYSQPSKGESVAWILFKDGLRSLTLARGIEDEEIVRFLEVIKRAQSLPKDAADDLLTLLWEQDFQHVLYTAVELGAEGVTPLEPSKEGWVAGPAPEAEEVQRRVREDVAEAEEEAPSGIVKMDDFDGTLYFLDEAELKYLKDEIEREYSQDLKRSVLSMLLDLLELQTYTAVRAELISILENFIPYLLAAGEFHSVAYLLRELRAVVERARELLPEHRKAISELPARLSQAESLGELLQSLDEAVVAPAEEDLSDLFGELRPEALQTVLEWLPKLTNESIKQQLDRAARRLAASHPEQVVQALEQAEVPVLIMTLQMIAQLVIPPFIPALGKLLGREEAEVRKEAVNALAATGSTGAMRELEKAIDDPEKDVRVIAVKALGERGHRAAFPKIEAVVTGKGLRNADLTEKTAFYEAYGLLAGDTGVATLSPMFETKGLLRRKGDPEARACAAMALGKIGGEEAKSVLQAAAGDEKDLLVKNAINKALREIG